MGFKHPKTRTYVRLLGPCFKTGQIRLFSSRSRSYRPTPSQVSNYPRVAARHPPAITLISTWADSSNLSNPQTSNMLGLVGYNTHTQRKTVYMSPPYQHSRINRTDRDTHGSHKSYHELMRLIRFALSNFRYFSLSFQRSFHLSLTVLVRYRSLANI